MQGTYSGLEEGHSRMKIRKIWTKILIIVWLSLIRVPRTCFFAQGFSKFPTITTMSQIKDKERIEMEEKPEEEGL